MASASGPVCFFWSNWANSATIVKSLEEALADPHFVARGLFAHKVATAAGDIPALPVPIAPQFRAEPSDLKAVPKLNE